MKSKEPFAFAGLYETWKSPTDKVIKSCTIITTTPNKIMAPIHDRMPVILRPEREVIWLSSQPDDLTTLTQLLTPYRASALETYQVSNYVNSPKNDGSECIRPLSQTTI